MSDGDAVEVVVPDEPPALGPAAAGALLRILLAAVQEDEEDTEL